MSGKTFYKFGGFWWTSYVHEPTTSGIEGPFCLECYADLYIPEDELLEFFDYGVAEQVWTGKLICELCSREHDLEETILGIKHLVALKLKSNFRATLDKIALDEPVTHVKVRDQDDEYFLSAKIGQKDGKRIGVVYFGEKNKDQSKKDYSQIFIDLDDEQVRFDKSNKHPKDILAKFEVEFPDTILISDFKRKKN